MAFERYVGVDYSGAEPPVASLKGLRVYVADRHAPPVEVQPPASAKRYWTRRGIAEWLAQALSEETPTVVDIEHGFSFPHRYFTETVCRSIGGTFWRTFNVIGRQMMTIPTSIVFAREPAAMQPCAPVMQRGGA